MFRRTVPVDDSSNRSRQHDPDGCSTHNVPRSDTRSSRGPVGIPVRHLAVYRLYMANPSTKPADKGAMHWHRARCASLVPPSVRSLESPNGMVPDLPGYVHY